MSYTPNREQAWDLLCSYTEAEALRKHALAVEGVMRHFAERNGEDASLWGVVGLLHDLDYEKYPDQHCVKVREIMQEKDIDETIIHAVVSHGYGICSDTEPQSRMEKTLYAIDELTGLITASALMRPSRSVMDLELQSLKKKYKAPNFAAGVDRSIIERGAAMLDMPLDELIMETILGMREVAQVLGLDGEQ